MPCFPTRSGFKHLTLFPPLRASFSLQESFSPRKKLFALPGLLFFTSLPVHPPTSHTTTLNRPFSTSTSPVNFSLSGVTYLLLANLFSSLAPIQKNQSPGPLNQINLSINKPVKLSSCLRNLHSLSSLLFSNLDRTI
ncbi:hypothetical protein ILYODFUR_035995 [Ilyodon furcidens]|uniref:Uncharacterized protein n=1 Tax=Ilyodon furcidens TaxID=33524 RepID=A0ABV0STC8_9TELE